MKICITSSGTELSSPSNPHFGRCGYFILFDTDTSQTESFENPAASAPGGAGIQAAQFISKTGADALLTGSVGPNAYPVLEAAGITVYTGITGSVNDALEQYRNNTLTATDSPTSKGHVNMAPADQGSNIGSSNGQGSNMGSSNGQGSNTGSSNGQGRGSGQGRGMGRGSGSGRGMGRGSGRGAGRN